MKKYYIKPHLEIAYAELQVFLAGSGGKYISGETLGGGTGGNDHKEEGYLGSGGDGDFEGQGAKDFNAWSSWDE